MSEAAQEDVRSEFTLTVTYPAKNVTEAKWLAQFAVEALRCEPRKTDWEVTGA